MQDTNPMTPLEMVEHLRKGIGSDGQVFTLLHFLSHYSSPPLGNYKYSIPFSYGRVIPRECFIAILSDKVEALTSVDNFNCE